MKKIAVFVDVIHHQGDFVYVPREHDAQFSLGIFDVKLVPVDVLVDFIHVGRHIIFAHLLNLRFESGWTGCGEQFFEKGQRFFTH